MSIRNRAYAVAGGGRVVAGRHDPIGRPNYLHTLIPAFRPQPTPVTTPRSWPRSILRPLVVAGRWVRHGSEAKGRCRRPTRDDCLVRPVGLRAILCSGEGSGMESERVEGEPAGADIPGARVAGGPARPPKMDLNASSGPQIPVTHQGSRDDVQQVLLLFDRFRSEVNQQLLQMPGPASEVKLVGCGKAEIARGMAALERRTRFSVRSVQRRGQFDPRDPYDAINGRSRARGLEMHLIVPPSALRSNPLLTTQHPTARVGPVTSTLVLIDDEAAVVPGPMSAAGDATAWIVRTPRLVASALELWHATWAVSMPCLPDSRPPLSPRQYATACLVSQGATDSQVGRQLGVSARTVGSDLQQICAVVGARSRAEMIARLLSSEI